MVVVAVVPVVLDLMHHIQDPHQDIQVEMVEMD
jgi:hypothetical protein